MERLREGTFRVVIELFMFFVNKITPNSILFAIQKVPVREVAELTLTPTPGVFVRSREVTRACPNVPALKRAHAHCSPRRNPKASEG